MYNYYIYNLKMNSEFHLPGMEDKGITTLVYEHEINIGGYKTNSFMPDIHKENKRERDDTEIYFERSYLVMRYKTQWEMTIDLNGKFILLNEDCDDINQAFSILLGTGLSILMMYLKYVPLHAGAFVYNDKVIAMVGKSGIGKSSFIRYIIGQGYQMMTEDTLPVYIVNNKLIACPSKEIKSKLNEDVISYFDIPNINVGQKIEKTQKRWVSVSNEYRCYMEKEMGKLYFLNPCIDFKKINISRLERTEKRSLIFKSINSIDDLPIDDLKNVMTNVSNVVNCIEAYIITYPMGMEQFPYVLKSIIDNE